jgi:hypothetical protein
LRTPVGEPLSIRAFVRFEANGKTFREIAIDSSRRSTRVRLALVLALTTVSCASARMAGRDVVAVAKAPVHEWKTVAAGAAVVSAALLVDDEIARIARNNDSTTMDRVTNAVEPFGGGASTKSWPDSCSTD